MKKLRSWLLSRKPGSVKLIDIAHDHRGSAPPREIDKIAIPTLLTGLLASLEPEDQQRLFSRTKWHKLDMESGLSALLFGLSNIRDLHLYRNTYWKFVGYCHGH